MDLYNLHNYFLSLCDYHFCFRLMSLSCLSKKPVDLESLPRVLFSPLLCLPVFSSLAVAEAPVVKEAWEVAQETPWDLERARLSKYDMSQN